MMIQAVLGNPYHPEYGVATIPFPIPHDQYAHCIHLTMYGKMRMVLAIILSISLPVLMKTS